MNISAKNNSFTYHRKEDEILHSIPVSNPYGTWRIFEKFPLKHFETRIVVYLATRDNSKLWRHKLSQDYRILSKVPFSLHTDSKKSITRPLINFWVDLNGNLHLISSSFKCNIQLPQFPSSVESPLRLRIRSSKKFNAVFSRSSNHKFNKQHVNSHTGKIKLKNSHGFRILARLFRR